MPNLIIQTEVQLGLQRRLVIPALFWCTLGFETSDSLIARLEQGRLILEKADTIKQRLKARFAHLLPTTSLANEIACIATERGKTRSE